jgi:glycosyltransferase involved in cell wall biosynthesis
MTSIIIPTLNEERYLHLLLSDLQKQTMKPSEVIVVDGGSEDRTQHLVKKYKDISLFTTKKNVGWQRTFGGKVASSDLLIFLDADVRIPKTFIEQVLADFQTKNIEAACPVYIPLTKSLSIKCIFYVFNTIFNLGQKHFPAGAGCGIIIKKQAFIQLRGFNHRLLNDDLDFIYRAGKSFPFAMLATPIFVSDRRFQKYGTLQTLWQYSVVSYHFIKGNLRKANALQYPFGTFSNN